MATYMQVQADKVFAKVNEYAVLETVTVTTGEEGEITNKTSTKSVLPCVFQTLNDEDYSMITAGHIHKSDAKVYVSRGYTVHAGSYQSGGATYQQFIHYPSNNSTTVPSTASKYEIMQVINVANMANYTPNNVGLANKLYNMAYVKEVMATGT